MRLKGKVQPPGDKSISHRMGVLSLLAGGRCRVENFSPCADCASTLDAVRRLGGRVERQNGHLLLGGLRGEVKSAALDCGNSGTTMRLLMGALAGLEGEFVLDGDDSLRRRPMRRVAEPLSRMRAQVEAAEGRPPVRITGVALKGVSHQLPVASAQLKSALLLAGLRASGETTVREPGQSRDHTERLLAACGADLTSEDGAWRVRPSEITLPGMLRVPGDISSAAFFLCGAVLLPGSDLDVQGVLLNPTRIGALSVLRRMGADLEIRRMGDNPEPWGSVRASHGSGLTGCRVEAGEIPGLIDEVPVLALAATQAQGTTVFEGVGELRVKECDRLEAVTSQLGAMGARLRAEGDNLVVEGPTPLKLDGELDSFGDHRIAMTLALAGALAGGSPHIKGKGCADISYPGFYNELERLLS